MYTNFSFQTTVPHHQGGTAVKYLEFDAKDDSWIPLYVFWDLKEVQSILYMDIILCFSLK
jgi:hypothetical protein